MTTNNAWNSPNIATPTMVYVANNGNDTTGTGSLYNPYKTIAHAYTTITTATPSNPFNIILLDNFYTETNQIFLKPNVGLFSYNGQCTINNSQDIVLDTTTWGAVTGNAFMFIFNLMVSNNIKIDFSLANSGAFPFVQFKNIAVNGNATFNGNANNDVSVYIFESYFATDFLATNMYILSYQNIYVGAFQVGNTTLCTATPFFYSYNDNFYQNVIVQTNAAEVVTNLFQPIGAAFSGFVEADGNKATINYDVTSWHATTLLNGAPTPNLISLADGVNANFTPAHYTATSGSVKGNLQGIDNKFANVISGTYTPTLTNLANITSSTAYQCQYMRVGNVVTVSGRVDVQATLITTSTQLRISLPIASNFSLANNCAGVGATYTSAIESYGIIGDITADTARMQWVSIDITSHPVTFSFTYLII